MNPGDVVSRKGKLWLVQHRNLQTAMTTLVDPDGRRMTVPEVDPSCMVMWNPSKSWPFVVASLRTPIMGVSSPTRPRMVPYEDWLLGDPGACRSAIFLSPDLNMLPGEILVVSGVGDHARRITIGPSFGTVARRRAAAERAISQRKHVPSILERIVSEDED